MVSPKCRTTSCPSSARKGHDAGTIDVEAAIAAERDARARIAAATRVDPDLPKAEAQLRKALLMQLVGRRASGTGDLR